MSIENNKDIVPSADVADGQIGKEKSAQVAEGNLKDPGKKTKAAKPDKQKSAKSSEPGEVIENLRSFDPFAEVDEDGGDNEKKATKVAEKIEIRIQQRNGRKTLTTVTNIPKKWNLKKICKQAKKRYNCNGAVIEDEEHGQVIQLQGDQRNNMHDFLCGEITNDEKNTGLGFDKEMVRVHGF